MQHCYALVSFHDCPLAWIKITELCPCLSYFPGFMAILKFGFSFENWWDKLYTKSVRRNALVNFAKLQILSNNFSKKCGYFDEKARTNLEANTYARLFQQKKNNGFVENNVSFWTVLWGQTLLHWYVNDQNYDQVKSNWYGCLLLSEVNNVQKPCLSQKSGFFQLFIGL